MKVKSLKTRVELPKTRRANLEKLHTVTLRAKVTMRVEAESRQEAKGLVRALLGDGKCVLAESGGLPFGVRVFKR